MASSSAVDARAEEGLFTNPWPALFVGLGATAAALLWLKIFHHAALPLVFAGLLATGAAVVIRPQSSLVLGLAALCGLFAYLGMEWDSARLLLGLLTGVAALAAIVLVLPRQGRRAVVSLLILVHFGGIATAVLSIPQPWLTLVTSAYFYRPYLEFMYLNNAYHFYSPEPGHGALIWFYVKYEDGTGQWYKIPNREENPLTLEYQRRLSLAESINQLSAATPDQETLARRSLAANLDGIYFHPEILEIFQYKEPVTVAKRMLETYSRHVARHVRHPTDPEQKVTGIKVYRVVHKILLPKEVVDGVAPDADWLYYPYYQGEFDADGKLKDPKDRCLYWLIPICKVPKGVHVPEVVHEEGQDQPVINCLEKHIKIEIYRKPPDPNAEVENEVPGKKIAVPKNPQ